MGLFAKTIDLNIPDMNCQHCVAKVSKVLDESNEVKEYKVQLDKKLVQVKPALNDANELAETKSKLAEIGYPAS
jgi:copper chaperone